MSIDFTGVVNIMIPEGEVYKITRKSDSVVLWEKPASVSDVLDDNDWATIRAVSDAGQAENYWSVGDCKAVILNGTVGTLSVSGTYYVYIIGFDHNGATNTIDFGTFKTAATGGKDICMVDSKYLYGSEDGTKYFNVNHWDNLNYGGWARSDIRYDILGSTDVAPSGYGASPTSGQIGYDASATCATDPVPNTLMSALPSNLRAVMKPMTIYTDNKGEGTGADSNVTVSIDYLPLLAEFEILGVRTYANSAEQNYQKQYSYYSSGNSKIKYSHSASGSTAVWWGRSPYYAGYNGFCSIDVKGNAYHNDIGSHLGIAPIFRV